jgi:two-component system, cell cycle sensor histidine kinase and response regulator CckA
MVSTAQSTLQPQAPLSPRKARFVLAALFLGAATLWFSSRALLSTNFLPHWYCYVGNQRLLWTNVISDLAIGLSYVAISATLVWLVHRAGRDLPYSQFFWAFGLFIVSCGATHFMEIVTVWKPVYWLSAAVKIITAAASVGTAVVLLVAADDIVEFVRTARRAAMWRANEQFRALVNAAPIAVVGSDVDGKINVWNPAAERLFGWTAQEVLGKVATITPPDHAEERDVLRQKPLVGEVAIGFETERLKRDGKRFPANVSSAPVFSEGGEINGTVRFIEDISERKSLESQVRQAQKMEVLGRLAGGVAHDFNNMLMVLGGCTELLERSLPTDFSSREYLDQIQRTIDKATAVTRQLLTFSRKQILDLHPMDLHEALTESEFMLPRLLGAGIELSFHHEARKSWIVSNPSQIEQLVANLAINASDAMPGGGRLTISTRNASNVPPNGSGTGAVSGEWVILEVSDTGCGMDEATRTQIFEPFFTTKPAGKGTGLGLSTVYGIVNQVNGHIHVESQSGVGTRFEIYFPCGEFTLGASEETYAVKASPESSPATNGGVTVLVADDETPLREAVVEILRATGYIVFEAQSALDAINIAEQQGKLDILLTDVVMPGLRGPELARRVSERHPGVHVIYMSGYAEGLLEMQLPPNSAFLQKPFRFATLLEQLKLVRRKA